MPSRAAHGTHSRYHYGCHCDECRAANTAHNRELRHRRQSRPVPEGIPHCLSTATNYGCKCDVCSAAVRERNRALYKRAGEGKVRHLRGGSTSHCPCVDCKRVTAVAQGKWFKQRNAKTLESATRYRYLWTGPDIEIASRMELSAREVAAMLGRTLGGVYQMRKRLAAKDPKVMYLLGATLFKG